MTKKQLTLKSVEALKEAYPEAICSLVYSDPLQLLIATRLSAQCTDARVNLVTPELFEKYKTLDDLANAEVTDIEKIIRSCGFYHDKAKDIVGIAKKIKSDFKLIICTHFQVGRRKIKICYSSQNACRDAKRSKCIRCKFSSTDIN